MKEDVLLLTRCGCTKRMLVSKGVQEITVPLTPRRESFVDVQITPVPEIIERREFIRMHNRHTGKDLFVEK